MGLVISSEYSTICVDYFASPDAERLVSPPIPADELAYQRSWTKLTQRYSSLSVYEGNGSDRLPVFKDGDCIGEVLWMKKDILGR